MEEDGVCQIQIMKSASMNMLSRDLKNSKGTDSNDAQVPQGLAGDRSGDN